MMMRWVRLILIDPDVLQELKDILIDTIVILDDILETNSEVDDVDGDK